MHVAKDTTSEHLNAFSAFCLSNQVQSIADLSRSLKSLLETELQIWVRHHQEWHYFSHPDLKASDEDVKQFTSLSKISTHEINGIVSLLIPINVHTVVVLAPAPFLGDSELPWCAIIQAQVERLLYINTVDIQEQDRDNAIASIAHDLKNPLTTIRGSAELVLRKAKKEDRTDREITRLQTIIEQADRMRDFLSSLVDVSRLHAGDLPLVKYPLDLTQLLEQTVSALNSSSSKPRIKLIHPPTAITIAADQIWLERVIENLLDNALKYSPQDKKVQVNMFIKEQWAVIEIKDQGIGIAASDLERIFKRFTRGKNSSAMSSGSGLGLYTVQTVIKAHQGTIDVHSEGINQGSLFCVKLPMLDSSDSSAT